MSQLTWGNYEQKLNLQTSTFICEKKEELYETINLKCPWKTTIQTRRRNNFVKNRSHSELLEEKFFCQNYSNQNSVNFKQSTSRQDGSPRQDINLFVKPMTQETILTICQNYIDLEKVLHDSFHTKMVLENNEMNRKGVQKIHHTFALHY